MNSKIIFLFIFLITLFIIIYRKPYTENLDISSIKNTNLDTSNILVSAICVTRKRVQFLKRAMENFINQSHPKKEIVVVYDVDDTDTETYLNTIHTSMVVKISNKEKIKLGQLRNLGIKNANGSCVIQWDDDDEYHPKRIELQLKAVAMHNFTKACCLRTWMIHDNITNTQYLSNDRIWEGSILAPTELLLKYPYPNLSRGEDTVVIDKLKSGNKIITIDVPELYVYHLHWKNTYEREHGLSILAHSIHLSIFYPILRPISTTDDSSFYGINKFFVINLASKMDRMKNIISECNKYNLNLERIDAVTDKNYNQNVLSDKCKTGKKAIACYQSHVRAMQRIAEMPENTINVIIEDDIVLRDSFPIVLQSIQNSLQKIPWDIVFLGTDPLNRKDLIKIAPCLYTSGLSTGTWAYMLSPRSARTILEKIYPIVYPIDLTITMPFIPTEKFKYDHRFDNQLKKLVVHTEDFYDVRNKMNFAYEQIDGSKKIRIGIVDERSSFNSDSTTN